MAGTDGGPDVYDVTNRQRSSGNAEGAHTRVRRPSAAPRGLDDISLPEAGGGASRLFIRCNRGADSFRNERQFSPHGGAGDVDPVIERPQLGE